MVDGVERDAHAEGVQTALALVLLLTAGQPSVQRAARSEMRPRAVEALPSVDASTLEVVWLEDQMCFCEWRPDRLRVEQTRRTLPGVPVSVPDDFAPRLVEALESWR